MISKQQTYSLLVVLLIHVVIGVIADNKNNKCSEDCDLKKCLPPEDCLAGLIKDQCNCCPICGQREGERCFNETLRSKLARSYDIYPDCGENMICNLRTDMEATDPPEAVCFCLKDEPICGSDGKTYDNDCLLNEERYKRRDGLIAASRGPCRTVPTIVSPPEDIRNKSGSYVAFSCEVKGWPVPTIEWHVQRDTDAKALPSDDPHIAVQSRGGPSNYEVTGWLQVLDITHVDQGTYYCVAKNSEGETKAGAKLMVIDGRHRTHGFPDKENEI
ncbi:insulin-like growth factor-binding protein-related protein 1 [Oppia nitens]|uniref:insulin-like growth factor-binding protein-related protein 1 n=1 Tax=Oppia nitens TaxID=1686743 RepID=UPI0023DAF6D2|nr:insulin-like growth factor-binding protein-related protein 1 [Oppia nitens]